MKHSTKTIRFLQKTLAVIGVFCMALAVVLMQGVQKPAKVTADFVDASGRNYTRTADGMTNLSLQQVASSTGEAPSDVLYYNKALTDDKIDLYLKTAQINDGHESTWYRTDYIVVSILDGVRGNSIAFAYVGEYQGNVVTNIMNQAYPSVAKPADGITKFSLEFVAEGLNFYLNDSLALTLAGVTKANFENGVSFCFSALVDTTWVAFTPRELPVSIRVGAPVVDDDFITAATSESLLYTTEENGFINIAMTEASNDVGTTDVIYYNGTFGADEMANVYLKPEYINDGQTHCVVLEITDGVQGATQYWAHIGESYDWTVGYNRMYVHTGSNAVWALFDKATDGITKIGVKATAAGLEFYYNGELKETVSSLTSASFPNGVSFKFSTYVSAGGVTPVALSTSIRVGEAAEVVEEKDTCEYVSVSTAGTPVLNFYTKLSAATVADENAYMSFVRNGVETQVSVANATQKDGYYVFAYEVPAKNMKDTVTAQIVRSDESKSEAISYSVAEYVETILNAEAGTYDEKVINVVSAMLQYGEYAAAHFNGTALEANEAINAVTAETLAAFKTEVVNAESANVLGMTLNLEAETDLRIYFKATVAPVCTVDGEAVEVQEKDGVYYVEIGNIAAKDLDKDFVVTIGDCTVTVCALDYAGMVCGGENTSLINLVKALYLYNVAANAYANE